MKTLSLRVAAAGAGGLPCRPPSRPAPPDRFFDSNGVQIRYVEQGEGPPVVMLHGYTGTLDRHFIANGVFATIAKDHRAIAMDLRGHGKSGKPHEPKAYGDELARDVVRLLDHLKIQARSHRRLLARRDYRRPARHDQSRSPVERGVHRPPSRSGKSAPPTRKFVEDSIRELESDLPFRSLAVAIQPAGTPLPSDDELRKLVAPLVAANDVKALAAMWRGGAFLLTTDSRAEVGAVPDDRNHRHARSGGVGSRAAAEGAPANQDAGAGRRDPRRRTSVLRRPETMVALRELWAGARSGNAI